MGIYDRDYLRDDSLSLAPTWNQRSAVETLIIINVAVYVANIFLSGPIQKPAAGNVNNFLLLHSQDLWPPYYWWRFLTYSFAHSVHDIFHLLFNMMGLYFLGRNVEYRYGKYEFLRIYLLTAVVCAIGWIVRDSIFGKGDSGLLGASGAVICIEMLFVFNFPRQTVYLFVFPVPAWVLGILLVLMNLTVPSSMSRSTLPNAPDPVAYDVHLIGITCAILYFFGGLNFYGFDDPRGLMRRTWRRLTGPRLKLLQPSGEDLLNREAEADRILAKIHEQGQDSLTSKEQKFLQKYSRAVRERKDSIE